MSKNLGLEYNFHPLRIYFFKMKKVITQLSFQSFVAYFLRLCQVLYFAFSYFYSETASNFTGLRLIYDL